MDLPCERAAERVQDVWNWSMMKGIEMVVDSGGRLVSAREIGSTEMLPVDRINYVICSRPMQRSVVTLVWMDRDKFEVFELYALEALPPSSQVGKVATCGECGGTGRWISPLSGRTFPCRKCQP